MNQLSRVVGLRPALISNLEIGGAFVFLGSCCAVLPANGDVTCSESVQVSISGGQLAITGRNVPLNNVLEQLEQRTSLRIHSPVVPDLQLSVSCKVRTMHELIACLFGADVDFVTRSFAGASASESIGRSEVWVTRAPALVAQDRLPKNIGEECGSKRFAMRDSRNLANDRGSRSTHAETKNREQLLALAGSNDPDLRRQAMSRLGNEGRPDDETVRKTLMSAFEDQDASIRAQALAALTRLGVDGSTALVRRALGDNDVAVRLMGVGRINVEDGDAAALLQGMLTDKDEAVSTLAAAKLRQLQPAESSAPSSH